MKSFSRRDFLRCLGLGTGALFLNSVVKGQQPPPSKRPNVIVFLADDLGYGDLGCYGHPFIKTPNLDKFARQGTRFTDCYSAAPICSPSRAALLTGRFSYRVGVYHLAGNSVHLRNQEKTIAELLGQAGYATCFLGKWHLGKFDGRHPTPSDQGFDHWFATPTSCSPKNPEDFIRNGKTVGKMKGWYCDLIVEEAAQWLKKLDPAKPF
ncbi:MAG: sulfatase-like hydrolase/transferase, partial [Planctomycetota bacterium]